jgi:LmbE family N-acetylglucosaminyl deacetylase
MGPRAALRRHFQQVILRNAAPFEPYELAQAAMIFAPHADDETLGCGGTIILKARASAEVRIVIVTNSGLSHAKLMPPEQMQALRRREALAAARQMGLDQDRVIFLSLPEGRLREHWRQGLSAIEQLLRRHQPQQVFIPYRRDVHPDHVHTNLLVRQAAARQKPTPALYEYPVWFWDRWPWTRPVIRCHRDWLSAAWAAMAQRCWRREFIRAGRIAPVLEQKMSALREYRSQMTHWGSDTRWPTLADVSDGEFLNCFFQEYEVFSPRGLGNSRQRSQP